MKIKVSDKLLYHAGMNRIPISGTFELTPVCNFSCKMCYVRKSKEEVKWEGGVQNSEQWIQWAKEAVEQGMLYLLITGGEPFVYPEFWELYERLTKMGLVITINSNGSMIDGRTAKRLSEMPPKRINITLYGASNESYERLCGVKDGFTRVMNAVHYLKENGIRYKYNCSLTPHNCHELKKMYEIAHEQKVPIEIATYMFPSVRREEKEFEENSRFTPEEAGYYSMESMFLQLNESQFRAYASSYMKFEMPDLMCVENAYAQGREMACRAGRCSFWLDWKGRMSACGMIDNPSYSLHDNSFTEAWNRIIDDTNKIRCLAQCGQCVNRHICHACISTAYCETGDVNGRPEYMCKMLNAEADACRKRIRELR